MPLATLSVTTAVNFAKSLVAKTFGRDKACATRSALCYVTYLLDGEVALLYKGLKQRE